MVTQASNSQSGLPELLLDARFWLVVSQFPYVRNRSVRRVVEPGLGQLAVKGALPLVARV